MKYQKNTYLLIMLIFFIGSCTSEQALTTKKSANNHSQIYEELLNMEYGLLINDYELVQSHTANLDGLLKGGYNLFCPEESAQIDGARMINQILAKNLQKKDYSILKDDLRILKAAIINLNTDDNYDPYFLFLWRFEEDMDLATQVAIDPMLDLYEYNEFSQMVDCMNNSWQSVNIHHPSFDFFNYNTSKYKDQSIHKIYLRNSIKNFNLAVSQIDNSKYPLCEMAEEVQEAYIQYIYTFIKQPAFNDSFLAII